MTIPRLSMRALRCPRARVSVLFCLLLSPNLWSSDHFKPIQYNHVPIVTALLLATSMIYQSDPEEGVTLKPAESRFDSGRAVFPKKSAESLDLRMTRGEVAVFRADGKREAVGIGDRFGKESYLVLAIRDDQIFFQSRTGFGLVTRNGDGQTVFELINRAHLPADVLELAPTPQ